MAEISHSIKWQNSAKCKEAKVNFVEQQGQNLYELILISLDMVGGDKRQANMSSVSFIWSVFYDEWYPWARHEKGTIPNDNLTPDDM